MSRDTIEIDKKGPPMTQTSKLGITPGECFLTGRNDHTEISGFMVIGIHREDNSTFATAYVAHIDDARLYADAHNVANRTGLTPGELVEAFLKYADHSDECNQRPPSEPCICGYGEIYAALTYITRDKP